MEINPVFHADGCTTNLGIIGAACNCGAERQAEISFKAGQQDQAAFDQLNFDKERQEFWRKIDEAKKDGMQEVVDYLREYEKRSPDYYSHIQVEKFEFRSWLKEKGLK